VPDALAPSPSFQNSCLRIATTEDAQKGPIKRLLKKRTLTALKPALAASLPAAGEQRAAVTGRHIYVHGPGCTFEFGRMPLRPKITRKNSEKWAASEKYESRKRTKVQFHLF
jgi:hypothetical protein